MKVVVCSDERIRGEGHWITQEFADAAMLRRVNTLEGREIVGQKRKDCAGLLFSYYFPGELRPHTYRIRRDNPDYAEKNGRVKASAKYLGAPGSANRLYTPPGVTLEQIADVTIPIVIVEGEKKALALWRLAHYNTDRLRFIPIAVSGVWNWRGTIGKTSAPQETWLAGDDSIPLQDYEKRNHHEL